MAYHLLPWILFNIFIVCMLAIDLFFHRKNRVISIREAVGWTLFWIVIALLFNLYIYYDRGPDDALKFLTGYLIEKSLSVDNLFVFLLIFKYFHTPPSSLHKVLFWGVLGAILLRALFIWLGIVLIANFSWMVYVFGVFLVYTGIRLWMEKDKKIHPENNPLIKIFRYLFRFTKDYEEDKFFVRKSGQYFATPLFVVLLSIETTDVLFAIDSIPAILAITYDPFLVYTSNIFAILGLRSLFFVLSHVMTLFHYLHYGLSLILIFIGTKMIIIDVFKIPTVAALGFVFLVLIASVLLSLIFPENKSKEF